MEQSQHCHCQFMSRYKSLGLAIVVSIVFGFFGLIYAGWWTALIYLLVVGLIDLLLPKIGLFIFIICWLSCPFIAAKLVERHNNKIRQEYCSSIEEK